MNLINFLKTTYRILFVGPLKVNKNLKIHEQITKDRWHQGCLFRDAANCPMATNDDFVPSGDTYSACAVGWLHLRYKGDEYKEKRTAVLSYTGQELLWVYNDTSSYEEIVGVLRKADV